MKTSLCRRKLSQIGVAAAIAGLFATASLPAQAEVQWRELNLNFKDYVTLDKLNTISSPQYFSSVVNVGADNTITVGDTFSETLTLLTNSSSLAGGTQDFALGGDYRFEVALNGVISTVSGYPNTLTRAIW